MSMTLEEMKLAVCEKLPGLIEIHNSDIYFKHPDGVYRALNWPTEGLQVCHEAEKLLSADEWYQYDKILPLNEPQHAHATYEQRLEALCRVWFPERF